MKAAIFEGIGSIVVKNVPDPVIEDGAIILKVRVCSVCGSDLRIYRHGHSRIKPPQIIGHEIAAEVVDKSSEVTGYDIGDRVTVTPRIACGICHYCQKSQYTYCREGRTFGYQLSGGYAEYMMVPSSGVRFGVLNKMTGNLTYEEASLTEPLACCIRAQRNSGVDKGVSVVVVGGGPVGIMHCRLAKAVGAGKVILIVNEWKRLDSVSLNGIDEIVDSTEQKKRVTEMTEGRGADVVIVACSSAEAQENAVMLAGLGGRVDFFGGLLPGQSRISIDSNIMHYKEVSVSGSHGSTPADNRAALDMLSAGTIEISDLISHTFPLDAVVDAFHCAESKTGMHVAVCP